LKRRAAQAFEAVPKAIAAAELRGFHFRGHLLDKFDFHHAAFEAAAGSRTSFSAMQTWEYLTTGLSAAHFGTFASILDTSLPVSDTNGAIVRTSSHSRAPFYLIAA